jgi:hypothetical protein
MQIPWKRALVGVALAAGTVVGGAVVSAQGGTGTQGPSNVQSRVQAFLDDVASHLGVTPDQLRSAIQAAELDQVNQAVQSGKITSAQADAIRQRIQSGRFVVPGLFGGFHRGGFGHRGPGMAGGLLNAAAQYLGLSPADLRSQLQGGKSLADIAQQQGKTVDGLVQAMLAPAKSRLDAAVSQGKLTQDREQAMLQQMQQRLQNLVNHKWTGQGPKGRGGWGHGWQGSPSQQPSTQSGTQTSNQVAG